jgi:hypothetical protein
MSVPLHRIHRLKKKRIFFFNFCECVRVKRAKKTKSVKLQRAERERETLTCCLGAGHWSSLLGLLSGAFHTAVKKKAATR